MLKNVYGFPPLTNAVPRVDVAPVPPSEIGTGVGMSDDAPHCGPVSVIFKTSPGSPSSTRRKSNPSRLMMPGPGPATAIVFGNGVAVKYTGGSMLVVAGRARLPLIVNTNLSLKKGEDKHCAHTNTKIRACTRSSGEFTSTCVRASMRSFLSVAICTWRPRAHLLCEVASL